VLKNRGRKAYGEMLVKLHDFLTSALDMSGQLHAPASLSLIPTGKKAGWTPELVAMANKRITVPDGSQTPVRPVVSFLLTEVRRPMLKINIKLLKY
jgi:hypothetical protein